MIIDDPHGAAPGVGPSDAVVIAIADLDQDNRGLVPGKGPVTLGTVGRNAIGAGREVGDRHEALSRSTCSPLRMPSTMRWAQRAARAMMVSAGLAEPWVGKTLPSTTYKFGTAKLWWSALTTPCRSSAAMRQPPTRWA